MAATTSLLKRVGDGFVSVVNRIPVVSYLVPDTVRVPMTQNPDALGGIRPSEFETVTEKGVEITRPKGLSKVETIVKDGTTHTVVTSPHATSYERALNAPKKGGKFWPVVGGIAAAAAAVVGAMWIANRGKPKTEAEPYVDTIAAAQPQAMLVEAPAEEETTQWRSRVRGQGQGISPASQPAQSVMPASMVQDLGAPPVMRGK